MARRKRAEQQNDVGLTTRQAKRKKQLSGEYLVNIDPLTDNQKLLFKYYDEGKNIFAHGVPGSGKTFCLLYKALKEVLDERTPYDKIYIVRSLVQTREIGFKVITGQGANIDTSTANGRLIFGIFAALAEYERELISERTKAGLISARARGRLGGRKHKMTPTKLSLAQGALDKPDTKISELCKELGISRQTLYRHVSPKGVLREDGRKLIAKKNDG
jgi:hypothetical protein